MKRKYLIDDVNYYFDTLKAAKLHISLWSLSDEKKYNGCCIYGYIGEKLVSTTDIIANDRGVRYGRTTRPPKWCC